MYDLRNARCVICRGLPGQTLCIYEKCCTFALAKAHAQASVNAEAEGTLLMYCKERRLLTLVSVV